MLLEVKNVSKTYAEHKALDNVSLSVPKNTILGLLGPNGAGKTTLIRIITQIIGRDSGEILFNNQSLNEAHVYQIGYLPEERGLYKKMKVGEQLLYLARLRGLEAPEAKKRIKRWVEKLGMQGWSEKNIQDLSKGMQQKVQFVATVIHQPELLILDEPFSGFDPLNASLIKDEILELRNQGTTIIFSTHRMESVEELCDHVVLINKSQKVLEGKTRDIKRQFKTNTFRIEYSGQLNTLGEGIEIIGHQTLEEDVFEAAIQLSSGITSNDLLTRLLQQVTIHRFEEDIPSMNDVFISLIK